MLEKVDHSAKDCCGMDKGQKAKTPLRLTLSELQNEHRSILARCNTLGKNLFEARTHASQRELKLMELGLEVKTLTALVKDHQSMEEQIILPIITKHLDMVAATTIQDEHLVISKILQDLGKTVKECGSASERLNAIPQLIERLESVLLAHFSHEENVIFWFAQFCLNERKIGVEASNRSLSITAGGGPIDNLLLRPR